MEPIGRYLLPCSDLSEAEFSERHAHPFLVHSSLTAGSLKPLELTRGLTVDRLVLGEPTERATRDSIAETFTVYAVRSRHGEPGITIGLSSECDIQVNDASLSRVHAYFVPRGSTWFLSDNDSATGTQVNGELLAAGQSRELAPGDRVTLGVVDLVFLGPAELHGFVRRLYCL